MRTVGEGDFYGKRQRIIDPRWAGKSDGRKLLELQVRQQQARSMAATMGAFQDAKELRALNHLSYRLYGRAGRVWFYQHLPGIAHLGFYSNEKTKFDPRARDYSIQFSGATYAEIFDQVVLWKATRA